MHIIRCYNCKKWFKTNGDMICPYCDTNNNITKEQMQEHYGPDFEENIIKTTNKAVTIWRFVKMLPILIVGIVFFLVGSYVVARNVIKSRDYVPTTAKLSRYEHTDTFNGSYEGYYKYKVDDIEYEIVLDELKKDYNDFDEEITIKYDSTNPKHVVFSSNVWMYIALFGLFFLVFSLMYIFGTKVLSLNNKQIE